jgi:uncharacterized protein
MECPIMPNALIHEKSPYLLQHAHNPVHWLPWGEDAFARARAEQKPILLSSGYSTCHWCHVMEHESFENEAIAALMNEHLICIKLDREERPDIDLIYMTYVQAASGHGGWPMNVFLTPELQPFYGGTYYPPVTKGRIGWPDLITEISKIWNEDRPGVIQRAADSIAKLQKHLESELSRAPAPSTCCFATTCVRSRAMPRNRVGPWRCRSRRCEPWPMVACAIISAGASIVTL